jgi:DNA end-binding protein Ku
METIFIPMKYGSAESLNHGLDTSRLHENEIKMAVNLIDNLSTAFDPARYQDEYRLNLWEIIEAKIAGQEVAAPDRTAPKANVVDLMEALQASVKIAAERRQATDQKGGKPRKKARTGT